jgi:large conductance mechanosensitive channel
MGRISDYFRDFKAFISKGNILDLAVAVIIGAAFSALVTGFVNDVISPLLALIGGVDGFNGFKWVLRAAAYNPDGTLRAPEIALRYGAFIQALLNFLTTAFVIFAAFRLARRARKGLKMIIQPNKPEPEPEKSEPPTSSLP